MIHCATQLETKELLKCWNAAQEVTENAELTIIKREGIQKLVNSLTRNTTLQKLALCSETYKSFIASGGVESWRVYTSLVDFISHTVQWILNCLIPCPCACTLSLEGVWFWKAPYYNRTPHSIIHGNTSATIIIITDLCMYTHGPNRLWAHALLINLFYWLQIVQETCNWTMLLSCQVDSTPQ